MQNLMIIPSLSCPANCKYCFGPCKGHDDMHIKIVERIGHWYNEIIDKNKKELEIIFHGGEPLAAGIEFYRLALPILKKEFSTRSLRFNIQSNLWLLTDEFCELFQEYNVSVGSSLDGPEAINDRQRGTGYFRKTMNSIEKARSFGIMVGCICTFTSQSIPYIDEIFHFFVREGLNFSIHATVPSLRFAHTNRWHLSSNQYGDLSVNLLNYYLDNLYNIRISTLDSMCRSVTVGRGGICTFDDCLGKYLCVDPNGEIYPCQRFCGIHEYTLGNISNYPSIDDLHKTYLWRQFKQRENRIREECGDCPHVNICKGGCPYNVLAAQGNNFRTSSRDPYCLSYNQIFNYITDRVVEEIFSKDNMDDIVKRIDRKQGLFRKGKLISIMQHKRHPHEIGQNAKRILSSVALATTNNPIVATKKMELLGLLSNNSKLAEREMKSLYNRLLKPTTGLNNLYLHITFSCLLKCTHCYAQADSNQQDFLSVDNIIRTCQEASKLCFRHVVITGGEPLLHPNIHGLLNAIREIRQELKPLLVVLRTSLSINMTDELLNCISKSTNQVVVSLDGDQKTHDQRRGRGNYDLVIKNLKRLVSAGLDTDLSLATVLPIEKIKGTPGKAVRSLAKELGIRRTRFRPLLPLGRATTFEKNVVPEVVWGHMNPKEVIVNGFSPISSCGIGKNLYVEPNGAAFPCYACNEKHWFLGDISSAEGLTSVINSSKFTNLRHNTVNSNQKCKHCILKYLCGGACRAWNRQSLEEQLNLNISPIDCTSLFKRAKSLFFSALAFLNISIHDWIQADLTLPTSPPTEVNKSKI